MKHFIQNRNKSYILVLFLLCSTFFNVHSQNSTNKEWARKELSKDFQEHLCALFDVYGYVRYFYPNDNLKDLDWFNFLMYAIKEIEPCKSEQDFERKLKELFSPICPDLEINDDKNRHSHYSSNPFYIQEHYLGGKDIKSVYDTEYITESKMINEYSPEYPRPDSLYTFKVNNELQISLPIALSKQPEMSEVLTSLINSNKKICPQNLIYKLLASEPFARLANEIIRCNIVQHFYPYYFEDGLDITWKKDNKDYFNKIANCESASSYYFLVCNMMSKMKDSHVNPTFNILNAYSMKWYPGIETIALDHKIFIKEVSTSYEGKIHPGDMIVKINNNDAESFVKEKLKYSSYSTERSGLSMLIASGGIFKSYKRDSVIYLTIRTAEENDYVVPIKTDLNQPYSIPNKDFIKKIDEMLYYVNLKNASLTNYDKFKEYIPEINKSRGIIFDLRGYPNEGVLSILANITDTVLSFGNLNEVHYYFPDQQKSILKPVEKQLIAPSTSAKSEEYAKKYEYPLPAKDKITVPCVFLINANSMSFMETIADIIKHYKLGTLIGENTAGCNGDTGYFKLPFASFTMSLYKFLNRDGTQHHGIGITPDIYVENKEVNKDSQLEVAKKYLNELE